MVNLRQREYRKKLKGGDATCQPQSSTNTIRAIQAGSNAAPKVRSSGAAKITELRELVARESEKPIEVEVVKSVYRDDYGRVISGRQFRALEKQKRDAKEGGYEIDEYAQ